MPLIVDHDARRHQLAVVAARLVAEHGPEIVTLKDIAAAAGFSTTVVSHYFGNKRGLLLFTHHAMALRSRERHVRALETEGLEKGMEALLPLDEEQQTEWKVYMAFWSRVCSEPEFEREQRKYTQFSHDLVVRALEKWRDAGRLRPDIDCVEEKDRLITVIVGIGTQWAYGPELWPPEKQRKELAREFAALRPAQ